jgi:hypothetical protein
MKSSKWVTFEKLGEAIRMAEERGAAVIWDDQVNGQPFDATVRVSHDSHEFLIVIDCVESEAPLTEDEVEAFTGKSRAVGARLAILVSTSGFTREAIAAGTANDVRLTALETIEGLTPEVLTGAFDPILWVYNFRFLWANGAGETMLPQEPEVLSFFMREMKIEGPGLDTVPEKIMEEHRDAIVPAVNSSPQVFEVPFPKGTTMKHPNSGHKTEIKSFAFSYRLLSASDLKSKEGLGKDPYLLGDTLKDELAKRNPAADPSKIESGYDTTLEPGRYYYNPRFRFSYYCESVNKSRATMVLVESYQGGRLVQAIADLSPDLSSQFVEVTEQAEIDRLAKLYEKFAVSDKNLEARFKVFAKNMKGAECVDDLPLTDVQRDANKADYLFDNRDVIGELKALQTDASDKIEKILEPYRESPEWPLFFGKQDLQKIIGHLPNREEINRKLVEAVTDSVETVIKKANRQIRETKRTFNLPDAGGLLIILNDLVEIISPDLIAYRVRKALNKRLPGGEELRFPNVSAVLIIGGAHYAQLNPNLKGIPILVILNNVPEAEKVKEFVSTLIREWSAFDGQPLITLDTDKAVALQFRKFSDDGKEQKGPTTVQEYWEWEYRRRPYLRALSKEDLLQFGRRVFEEMTPNFLKGVPKAPPEQAEGLMMQFTHFLEEMRFRGIDMREFSAKLEGLKEKIDELLMRRPRRSDRSSRPAATRAQQSKHSKEHKNKIGRGAPCPCQSGRKYSRCCGAV